MPGFSRDSLLKFTVVSDLDLTEEEKSVSNIDTNDAQYYPKGSSYYHHDDRCDDAICNPDDDLEQDSKRSVPKKSPRDRQSKWLHDKFNSNMQAPRTDREIIARHGYNIRRLPLAALSGLEKLPETRAPGERLSAPVRSEFTPRPKKFNRLPTEEPGKGKLFHEDEEKQGGGGATPDEEKDVEADLKITEALLCLSL